MENLNTTAIATLPEQPVTWETTAGFASESLEVNVIFTDPEATATALKFAESFARDLGACIRLRAAIIVPMRLPLDQPPVSVRFAEELLSDLACQLEQDAFQPTVHLYVCRDWAGTLVQVLKPNSLIVIGGREHRWPTPASRMSRILRAKGHRVLFVDLRGEVRVTMATARPLARVRLAGMFKRRFCCPLKTGG
jgi:hypothetical protein